MSIPKDVYPIDFDGPIGIIECSICGIKTCFEEGALQDEWNHQIYCEDCYIERLEELTEELEEAFGTEEE